MDDKAVLRRCQRELMHSHALDGTLPQILHYSALFIIIDYRSS